MFEHLLMTGATPAGGVSVKSTGSLGVACYNNFGIGNWAKLDSTRYILSFTENVDSNHWPAAVVVEVAADGSFTAGTPYYVESWTSGMVHVGVLDSSTAILEYVGTYPTYVVLTISGTTVTGAGTPFTSSNYWPYGARVAGFDSTHGLAVGNNTNCYGSVLTNTGGTITEGTPLTFSYGQTPSGFPTVVDAVRLTDTTAVAVYARDVETYGQVLTRSGSSLGAGTETWLHSISSSNTNALSWAALGSTDKFLVQRYNLLSYFTVSGTTVTLGSTYTLTSLYSGWPCLAGLTDTTAILCANSGPSGEILAGRITRTGSSLSLGTQITEVLSEGSIVGLTGIGVSETLGLFAHAPYSDGIVRFFVLEAA